MKLASYVDHGRATWGAMVEGGVVELPAMTSSLPPTLREALQVDPGELRDALQGRAWDHRLDQVELLPPVPDPGKIICVGLNYVDHRTESRRRPTDHPTLFIRFSDSQVGHDQPVAFPANASFLDYEGELAVIVGRPGYRLDEADALDHVAGYACYNDLSVRDWQHHTSQFTAGKNFLGVGAFGPWMVTADEVDDLDGLRLETRVNGEVRQTATVKDMIFSVPELLAYITAFTPLDVGDVIVTGTPGGVGYFRDPPVSLAAGDVVEVEISGVGLLRTPLS
jgi:2-keto-4-pentenoate hydratase/2-oxohepta-3-ene-1,7-dioic acid hydratase in catechol pathway